MNRRWWEWHLTPSGWREGEYLEPFGRVIGKPTPADAVLTLRQFVDTTGHEETAVVTRHGSDSAIKSLQGKYGAEPPT